MVLKKVVIYDTTLRDGAQAQGISFTVEDKLKIAKAVDDLGILKPETPVRTRKTLNSLNGSRKSA
jgi:isopropylmalate/homocitrate/citramalate synthase